jgi:ESCRT-II complex subunit VPS36
MFLHQLDLTTALRPSLLPEETLLFVQDAVGLYEGYAHDCLPAPPRLD